MHSKTLSLSWRAALLAAFAVWTACADVVETKSGARLVGTLVKIDGGVVTLKTDYAGVLEIKQSEVVGITTDQPVSVRLQSGDVVQGTVATNVPSGQVAIAGSGVTASTTVGAVAATWSAGGEDPRVSALRRKWKYQAGVDVSGKSGNSESLSMAARLQAILESLQDVLKFYVSYDRAEQEVTDPVTGRRVTEESADETKGGVDYSNYFYDKLGWYGRSELEKDDIEGVELRSTTDVGLTYRWIKNDRQELRTRAGVAYRYESFDNNTNEGTVALSTGLLHSYIFSFDARVVTEVQWLPSFEDFADYRLVHDSGYEMPLARSKFWKLRIGLENDYNSQPLPGREKLDTTYYTRLILSWE